jgi:hypothetical protein
MKASKYAYAAVGAPVEIAKQLQEKLDDARAKVTETALGFSKDARSQVEAWSKTGEKLVGKVTDTKKIDEFTAKVDLEQAKEQVHKLREQLDDLLSTWKTNFRPEGKVAVKEPVVIQTAKPVVKVTTPAAKATAAKKPAAKATAAKKPVAKVTAKKPAAKATAAKKPAARKPVVKAS